MGWAPFQLDPKSPPKNFDGPQNFPCIRLTDCGNERGSKRIVAESEENAGFANTRVLKQETKIIMNSFVLSTCSTWISRCHHLPRLGAA